MKTPLPPCSQRKTVGISLLPAVSDVLPPAPPPIPSPSIATSGPPSDGNGLGDPARTPAAESPALPTGSMNFGSEERLLIEPPIERVYGLKISQLRCTRE